MPRRKQTPSLAPTPPSLQDEARRCILLWRALCWENDRWNEWRAERGLPPLPQPRETFALRDIPLAGFTPEEARGWVAGTEEL